VNPDTTVLPLSIDASRLTAAQALATRRLLELRDSQGAWDGLVDISATLPALFIVLLRTTGLIAKDEYTGIEIEVARHLLTHANPDGGFYKYRGAPSSVSATRLVRLVLGLVLGTSSDEVAVGVHGGANPRLDQELRHRLRGAVEHSTVFLHAERTAPSRQREPELALIQRLVAAYVLRGESPPFQPLLSPLLTARLRLDGEPAGCPVMSYLLRRHLPALSILHHVSGHRGKAPSRQIERLCDVIRDSQNSNGGWVYSSLTSILNLMALTAAGMPSDHPCVGRGLAFLRGKLVLLEGEGVVLNTWSADNWYTAVAVSVYLLNPEHGSGDEEIWGSIERLIQGQRADGGLPFGSGSENNPDIDTTAVVVSALGAAKRSAAPDLSRRIQAVIDKGLAFMVARQSRDGGFSEYDRACLSLMPGPFQLMREGFFSSTTTGVTARALMTMGFNGWGLDREPVRRALAFLLRHQSPNGAWWCRWWAAYLPGSEFALSALGSLGISVQAESQIDDPLWRQAQEAMRRCVAFIRAHQNPDGGWGETVRADVDIDAAGVGASDPVKTALALIGLEAAEVSPADPCLVRGFDFLFSRMTSDGRWDDDTATYTIFSGIQYYAHPLPAYLMPLWAISAHLARRGA